ncbi:GIY-YIG nuclease family protein [Vibrio sp.]|nr:GIY-YIG nuclease family protein [Vibrio sp.]
MSSVSTSWWVYLVRTHQGQLYCGISTDVERRFKQHESGIGAKFLRGKGPLSLEWFAKVPTHSAALKCEVRIKRLSKASKEKLIVEPKYFRELITSFK